MATIDAKDMACPRLEFRWEKGEARGEFICHYNFVFPLREHDIRREREDADGNELPDVPEYTVEIGKTRSNGGGDRYSKKHDAIDTPFRDGAHAQWDSEYFGNPPIYAVCDGRAMLVVRKEAA